MATTGFAIPNLTEAPATTYGDLAELDRSSLQVLVAAARNSVVTTGCAVTAQGTPNNTVAVAAGQARSQGKPGFVTAGNVTISNGDGTNPRKDLVYLSSSFVKSVRNGTPHATTPLVPDLNDGEIPLAIVYRPVSATTVTSTMIVDVRVMAGDVVTADLRDFGAKIDGGTDDYAAYAAAYAYVVNSSAKTKIILFHPGTMKISQSLTIVDLGVILMSLGPTGTRVSPMAGMTTGALLYLPSLANGGQTYFHSVVVKGIEFYGGPSHGVFWEGGTGEGSWFEGACNNNTGDGFRFAGGGTPSRFGWIMVHGNGGDGMYVSGAGITNFYIDGLSGDDNGSNLIEFNGLGESTICRIGQMKIERRTVGKHNTIINMVDLNGATVIVGQGRFSHDTTIAAPTTAAVIQSRTAITKKPGVFVMQQVSSSVWTDNIVDKWPLFYDNQITGEQTGWLTVRERGFSERPTYSPPSAEMPTPTPDKQVQYDTFTGADATTLTGRNPDVGGPWNGTGSWSIQGNAAEPNGNNHLFRDVLSADAVINTVVNLGNEALTRGAGIIFRRTDVNNFWRFHVERDAAGLGSLQLYRSDAGTFTQLRVLNGVTVAASTNYALKVIVVGGWAKCYFEGVERFRWYVGDLAPTATNHGVVATARGGSTPFVRFDNVELLVPGPSTAASVNTAPSSAIANTTTETAFSVTQPLAANELIVGKTIRVSARGVYGTNSTGTLTIRLKLKIGSVVIADTGAFTLIASQTNRGWDFNVEFTCVVAGAAGSVEAQGRTYFTSGTLPASATTGTDAENTATIGSIDTTAAQTLSITAQHGAASANNTITLRQFLVERLN